MFGENVMCNIRKCLEKRLGLYIWLGLCFIFLAGCGKDLEYKIEAKNDFIEIEYADRDSGNIQNVLRQYFTVYDVSDMDKPGSNGPEPIEFSKRDLEVEGYKEDSLGKQSVTVKYKDKAETAVIIQIKQPKLETPYISCTGGRVNWEKVDNAGSYTVYVNGHPIEGVKDSSYSLDDCPYSPDENNQYRVSVKAVIKEKESLYVSSEESEERMLTKLLSVEGLDYKDGKFVWNKVDGAEIYKISINNSDSVPIPAGTYEYKFDMKENEGYTVSIVAQASMDNIVQSDATEKKFRKILPVTEIEYSNRNIKWTIDKNSYMYQVTIDGELMGKTNLGSFGYDLKVGKEYSVLIEQLPRDNENLIVAEAAEPVTIIYSRLANPVPELKCVNFKERAYEVVMPPVENATGGYIVKLAFYAEENLVRSYVEEIADTEFEFKINQDEEKIVNRIVAEVIAVNKEGDYEKSDAVQVELQIEIKEESEEPLEQPIVELKKLATPKPVITSGDYKNNYILKFDKVDGADEYEIEEIYYTQGGKTYPQKPYRTTDLTLEFEIPYGNGEKEIPAKVSKIEVLVTAISKNGVHENSEPGQAVKELD